MQILFVILIVIASVALGFLVLIQNPKGGGLAGNVGGFGNQFMGVKQTTDVLEKGTWIFAGAIAILAIFSTIFFKTADKTATDTSILQKVNTSQSAPVQQSTTPASTAPATTPAQPQSQK
jgi:preprotein translocase subunit SecG